MKRIFAILLIVCVMFSVCACSKTNIDCNADVTLTYIYLDKNISVPLEKDEAEKVIDILDGNTYDAIFAGVPSCGFDKNVSLEVGGRVFAIARDTCNCIQDLGNLRFFDVSHEEIAYIHSLFEKYGGHFPCV